MTRVQSPQAYDTASEADETPRTFDRHGATGPVLVQVSKSGPAFDPTALRSVTHRDVTIALLVDAGGDWRGVHGGRGLCRHCDQISRPCGRWAQW